MLARLEDLNGWLIFFVSREGAKTQSWETLSDKHGSYRLLDLPALDPDLRVFASLRETKISKELLEFDADNRSFAVLSRSVICTFRADIIVCNEKHLDLHGC